MCFRVAVFLLSPQPLRINLDYISNEKYVAFNVILSYFIGWFMLMLYVQFNANLLTFKVSFILISDTSSSQYICKIIMEYVHCLLQTTFLPDNHVFMYIYNT